MAIEAADDHRRAVVCEPVYFSSLNIHAPALLAAVLGHSADKARLLIEAGTSFFFFIFF